MQKILFTGARSGLVHEVIQDLLDQEFDIYLSVHTQSQYKEVRKQYQHQSNVTCLLLDITKKEDREKVKALDLDILVNHAGIGYGGSLMEMPMDLVRKNFETNVFSSFELVQLVLKNMLKKGHGRIVIMGSIAGILPFRFLGAYCGSKASINMMSTILQKEAKLLPQDISIVLVEPGAYHTGFNQVMLENKYDWMEESSYFHDQLQQIRRQEQFLWHFIEKKHWHSIIRQYKKAITDKHPKKIYRAPFTQVLFAKLYQFFRM